MARGHYGTLPKICIFTFHGTNDRFHIFLKEIPRGARIEHYSENTGITGMLKKRNHYDHNNSGAMFLIYICDLIRPKGPLHQNQNLEKNLDMFI